MNLKNVMRNIVDSDGLEKINNQMLEIYKENGALKDKIESMQATIAENSRALSMLAIIQTRLINEIGELVELNQREKKKKTIIRKNPGPEFTN